MVKKKKKSKKNKRKKSGKKRTPVSKMSKKQLRLAKKIHRSRSRRARKMDESKAGKVPKYFETWLRHPERYDLPGIDTPKALNKLRKSGYIRVERGGGRESLPQWIRERGGGLASGIEFRLRQGKETMYIDAYPSKITKNYVVVKIKPIGQTYVPKKYIKQLQTALKHELDQDIRVEKGKYGYALLIPKSELTKYKKPANRIYENMAKRIPMRHSKKEKEHLINKYAAMIALDKAIHRMAKKHGIKILG